MKLGKHHPSKVLAAVPLPHEGSSINPDHEAHQDALADALSKELAARQAQVEVAEFDGVSVRCCAP